MERLNSKEEEIMQIIWNLQKCFVKDVIEIMENPKPPYTTVSSIIKNLELKGFLAHNAYGNTYQYYPVITKEEYLKKTLRNIVKNYFDNSYNRIVSFLVNDENLSKKDITELSRLIKNEVSKEIKDE